MAYDTVVFLLLELDSILAVLGGEMGELVDGLGHFFAGWPVLATFSNKEHVLQPVR